MSTPKKPKHPLMFVAVIVDSDNDAVGTTGPSTQPFPDEH